MASASLNATRSCQSWPRLDRYRLSDETFSRSSSTRRMLGIVSTPGLRRLGNGQEHLEDRPMLLPADLANDPTMPLNHAADHAQAKARAAVARRKEWREDRVLEARRDAATVVRHAKPGVRRR